MFLILTPSEESDMVSQVGEQFLEERTCSSRFCVRKSRRGREKIKGKKITKWNRLPLQSFLRENRGKNNKIEYVRFIVGP